MLETTPAQHARAAVYKACQDPILGQPISNIVCLAQVYGPESSGKTTLALHAMAAVQRAGGTALLVDAEHAFDAQYSKVPNLSRDTQP